MLFTSIWKAFWILYLLLRLFSTRSAGISTVFWRSHYSSWSHVLVCVCVCETIQSHASTICWRCMNGWVHIVVAFYSNWPQSDNCATTSAHPYSTLTNTTASCCGCLWRSFLNGIWFAGFNAAMGASEELIYVRIYMHITIIMRAHFYIWGSFLCRASLNCFPCCIRCLSKSKWVYGKITLTLFVIGRGGVNGGWLLCEIHTYVCTTGAYAHVRLNSL